MAFFSSNSAYDGAQLRRKRSLSRERPSTADKSSGEALMLKRSPSISTPSSSAEVESPDIRPPLPTPVSAGMSRPRRPAQPDKPSSAKPLTYEQSSTPIPFTKPIKRNSPPPFSNLIINVTNQPPPRHSPSTSSTRARRAEMKSSNQTDVDSSLASSPTPRQSSEQPSPAQGQSANPHDPRLSTFARSKSHSPTRSRSIVAAPAPTSKPTTELDSGVPPKEPDSLVPVGASPSPSPPPPSRKTPRALPTPVSPHQSSSVTRTDLGANPSDHARSRSHSRTPQSPSPTANSTAKYAEIQPQVIDNPRSPPPSAPASGSGTSTYTRDAASPKHQEKRPRNVLRKPSVTRREPKSAPTSDGEQKVKTHRPRARSGVFAAIRRNSSGGGLLDFIHPREPTTDLTPASEILVAYKEKELRRDTSFGSSREASFGNSGKLVAVGGPDDEAKAPWTAGWRSVRSSHDESPDDMGKRVGLRRSLSRKLSERWGGKDPEQQRMRPDGSRRSMSGGAVGLSQEKPRRHTPARRSTSSRKETKFHISSTSGLDSDKTHHQSGWPQETDDGEGRVWEEDIGDWALGHIPSREGSDASSPGRLWRLVKRFSSGNLKEKNSPPLEAPPPVPPLPKDVPRARWAGSGEGPDPGEMPIPQTAVLESPGVIMRYITSMPSLSITRVKHTRHRSAHRRADLGSDAPAGPSTSDVSTRASQRTGTRRSTTTRSSSPSSENTKLFSRSRSSSDSSYGETVPPMPNTHVGQHIVPPHELYRIANAKGDDDTAAHLMPMSPPAMSSVVSLTIPRFEVQNPSNNFVPYKSKRSLNSATPPMNHFPDPNSDSLTPRTEQTALPYPPPIPSRNPRRPSSISAPSLQLPVRQHSLPGVIPVQGPPDSEATDVEHRSASTKTAKSRPRSISDGAVVPEPTRSPATAQSILTFREMTTTKRPLTEQEKNAKWEDLLQRSDMAGGTLHVGSPATGGLALWSDRRSSLAPSETLDRF